MIGTISDRHWSYPLPGGRMVRIDEVDGKYSLVVTQGDCVYTHAHLPSLAAAIVAAQDAWPEGEIDAEEVEKW